MRIPRSLALIAAGFALAGAAAAAPAPSAENAAAVNAGLQAMRDYNLIVLKNLSSSSEVEGRTFVGGNLSGGSSNYFTKPNGLTGGTALTVGGNVTGGSKNINNGGALKVGGNLDSGANMNGAGQVYVDGDAKKVNANNTSVYVDGNVESVNAKDIYHGGTAKNSNGTKHAGDHTAAGLQTSIAATSQAYATELLATSGYFADLDPTHFLTYSANGQQAIFDAGAGTGVAVFAIGDLNAALKNRSQLIFNMPVGYDAVVVNVAGLSVSLPSSINFNGPSGLGTKVIWNFFEATTVNLGSKSWYGSVLAPNADLRINNFIEGSVVARNMTQNGEVHMKTFSGSLSVDEMRAAVPEPATWALMILGFGAVGVMLRRRRSAFAGA